MGFINPKNNAEFNEISQNINQTFDAYYENFFKTQPPIAGSEAYKQYADMKNAYGHAYGSAYMTYVHGAQYSKFSGLMKELFTINDEIKNNSLNGTDIDRGKTIAYKDGSRDMWNNTKGIEYALDGINNKKGFGEVSQSIFNNIVSGTDFIVDFNQDNRRWEEVNSIDDYTSKIFDNIYNEIGNLFKSIFKTNYELFVSKVGNIIKLNLDYNDELSDKELNDILNDLNDGNLLQGLVEIDTIKVDDKIYAIKSWNTISNSAKRYGMSEEELIKANPWLADRYSDDKSFALIRPGEQITIPQEALQSTDISDMYDGVSSDLKDGYTKPDIPLPDGTDVSLPSHGKPVDEEVRNHTTPPAMLSKMLIAA